MSLASQEETINFHMNDINRKKNMETMVQGKEELWNGEIDDILEKQITDPGIMDDFLSSVETEPQRAEIELKMQKQETTSTEVPGRTKWVIEGMKLQEEHVSSTQAEQRRTLNWQNQLGPKIVKHNEQGTQWLEEDAGEISSIRLHCLLDEDEWSATVQ
ncbi:hypothetical protein BC826DRAFT_974001 [Russula brevipes]|nr:hypothetical protein BC826DRAFT_974001 [Russula brevipes]